MEWIYNDGGRAAAGYKGKAGDCACRAIAIATGMDYQDVYDLINAYGKKERMSKRVRARGRSNARTGVWKETFRKIMADMGWTWVSTMQIGSGCKVHLSADELPSGRIICQVSHHYVAVIDGVINDTYDPNDRGCTVDAYGNDITTDRCVYGYYYKA